jgi:hypothetical protein
MILNCRNALKIKGVNSAIFIKFAPRINYVVNSVS